MFEPRAFWGDEEVGLLGWAGIGIYMALLSRQWEEGDIPDDRRRLASIIAGGERERVTDEQLDRLIHFFPVVEGDEARRRNGRLHREREEWIAKKSQLSEAGSAAGKASGEARRKRRDERIANDRSTTVQRSLNESERIANESEPLTFPLPPNPVLSDPKDPPEPPKDGTKAAKARGRKIPPVKFPPSFLRAGLTAADFEKRVRTCSKVKRAETWQGELDATAAMIDQHAAAAVELYRQQFETGYQGIPWDKLSQRQRLPAGTTPTTYGNVHPDDDFEERARRRRDGEEGPCEKF